MKTNSPFHFNELWVYSTPVQYTPPLLKSVNLASVKYFRLGSPLTTTNKVTALPNLEILAVSRTTWYKKD